MFHATKLILEAPIRLTSDATFQPWLAESWEESEDGIRVTLHLRQGVKFHNGRELTADDVVWAVELARNEELGHHLSDRFKTAESNPGPSGPGSQWPAHDAHTWLFFLLSGPVTAIPLLLFAAGARRVPLSTMGFLQYIAPTLQFLLGVLVYREPFTRTQLAGYGLVWAALVLFAAEGYLAYRAKAAALARL